MKLNKISIAMLLISLPSFAESSLPASEHQPGLMDNQQLNPFFSQSHLTLSVKNYWKYLKEDMANPKEVHNAWGQGIAVDFQSGYFADFIGFDTTYYGASKLAASDYFNSRGVLYSEGSGNNKRNAKGFSKIGQRNIKVKYDSGDTHLNGRWGWQTMKNYGVITNSTRLSPTTYAGTTAAINTAGLTLRGAWIENSMARNSPDKMRFQTNTGADINYIATGDLQWESKVLDLQYGYGESDNYLRRHILFSRFRPTETLSIGTQVYATQALENYQLMPANKRDFDHHARHMAIDATWQQANWSSKWGVGYTEAHKQNAVGFYPRHMSKNSRGTFISMAYAGDDYMRDREIVLATISDYKLTPELTVGLTSNIAQFHYKGNAVRSGEVNVFSRWAPSHAALKNLTVWTMFGPGWSYKNKGKTPVLKEGKYSRTHTLSSEVIIEYKFNII